MKRNITKISVVFVFAALFIFSVGSAQATESIWFSGHDQYQPATNAQDGGFCYSIAHNSENIYLSTNGGLQQEAMGGTCGVPDGRNYSIWLQAENTSS